MSRRLSAVAELVPQGAVLADIGTDHAWLPIHLVHQRKVPSALAADVRPAPLQGAQQRVQNHRLSGRIELRQGSGLTVLTPGEATVVTIAGMGGKRIIELVRASPAVVARLDRLVVQPNTEVPRVRRALSELGLCLEDERLIHEDGRWYSILAWRPGNNPSDWSAEDFQFGPSLRQRADPALRRFLGDELTRIARILAKATHQGAAPDALRSKHHELALIEAELARLALVERQIRTQ